MAVCMAPFAGPCAWLYTCPCAESPMHGPMQRAAESSMLVALCRGPYAEGPMLVALCLGPYA
jgi:hypothetical protein